jgi:hypothetical protein
MRTNRLHQGLLALAVVAGPLSAQAADFTFDGNVHLNTDIVRVAFTLDTDATAVKVWTDSYFDGVNYDPITALWRKQGAGYTRVAENDDSRDIAPNQTFYDSGFALDSLAKGDYLFTVGAFPNFAYSLQLSDGFQFDYDGTVATPIANWNQPSSRGPQKGTFWRVNLSGVDSATAPVPEPSTYALMALGLAAIVATARRRAR